MRANPYDWMRQSREHRRYAQTAYPVIAGLAGRSNGYAQFALGVQRLSPRNQQEYVAEWNDWHERFGKSWEKLGCIKETRLGQFTSRYRWSNAPGRGTRRS